MYGAILGDIIGSRFEFDRGWKTKDFELLTEQGVPTQTGVFGAHMDVDLLNSGPVTIILEM